MEWRLTFMPATSYRHLLHYVRASAMPVISHLVFSDILLPLPLPLHDGRGSMPVVAQAVGIAGAYNGHGPSLVASLVRMANRPLFLRAQGLGAWVWVFVPPVSAQSIVGLDLGPSITYQTYRCDGHCNIYHCIR